MLGVLGSTPVVVSKLFSESKPETCGQLNFLSISSSSVHSTVTVDSVEYIMTSPVVVAIK